MALIIVWNTCSFPRVTTTMRCKHTAAENAREGIMQIRTRDGSESETRARGLARAGARLSSQLRATAMLPQVLQQALEASYR